MEQMGQELLGRRLLPGPSTGIGLLRLTCEREEFLMRIDRVSKDRKERKSCREIKMTAL